MQYFACQRAEIKPHAIIRAEIQMGFNLENITGFVNLFSALGIAFLFSLWIALIFWTYRDSISRIKTPIMRFLGVLIVIMLFIPGVIIYLIVRPPFTIEERYMRTLEEEALLRTIEEKEFFQDK